MRILVVEDDPLILNGLAMGLSLHSMVVDGVNNCEDAHAALATTQFNAVVLDWMLPDGSGIDVLRDMRSRKDTTPVLLLTARDAVEDRIRGLDEGADDYLGKPFDLDEVAARLRALDRRAAGRSIPNLVWQDLTLNPATMEVSLESKPLILSRREFAVLSALMERPGIADFPISTRGTALRVAGRRGQQCRRSTRSQSAHQNRPTANTNASRHRLSAAKREHLMSLRTRLFLILVASTSLIWISGFTWIGINSKSEIDYLLDRRLMEAARMVASLNLKTDDIDLNLSSDDGGQHPANRKYERRLSCQIWSFDGHLIGRSANAPTSELTEQVGDFSERRVDGVLFRVYALEDTARGIRVLVGDEVEQRRQAVRDLLSGLMIPAMIILPAIGFLIWISIRRGLAPLRLVTETLTARDAENLAPLKIGPSPPEIQPSRQCPQRVVQEGTCRTRS